MHQVISCGRIRHGVLSGANLHLLAISLIVLCCALAARPASGQLFGPPQVISANATSGRQIATADLDKDGDLDVLGASYLGDGLSWYENDGTPGGLGDWVRHSITPYNLPNSAVAADIDGDGNLDVVAANSNSVALNNIAWYQSDGTPRDGGWGSNTISNPGTGRRVLAVDVDGDGDLDVVGASANAEYLAWYENDGTPAGLGDWPVHLIATAGSYYFLAAVDMDHDGDIDIVGDSGGIGWWENDGKPAAPADWTFHSVDATLTAGAGVSVADIDRDGDPDIVAATLGNNRVVWYANTNGLGAFGAAQVISNTATNAFGVFAVDLDGDGDPDVLAGSTAVGASVAWYENDGTPGGLGDWTQHVIDAAATGATWVHAADLDGDHHPDALAMLYSNQLVWYRNLASNAAAVMPLNPGYDLAIQSVRPIGTGGGFAVTLTLPSSDRSRVELFDLSGRRKFSSEFDGLTAGSHTVNVAPDSPLASGIYWVRLAQDGRAVSARTTIAY